MIRLTSGLLVIFSFHFTKVEAGCDVLRTGSSGEIQSINYPMYYLANHVCDYIITTDPSTIIHLTFQGFNLENSNPTCNADYVQINDGDNINATMIGRFCGSALPPEIRSSKNSLFLRFRTDHSAEEFGFLANYSTILVNAPPVTNVSVTPVSSSSARIQWKGLVAPFTVDNYTVTVNALARRHSPSPGCPATTPLHSAITVTVNGSTTATAITLPTDVEFRVFVTSVTSSGLKGQPSDTATGYTLAKPSEAVRDLSSELSDSADTVTLSWGVPCEAGGVLNHFLVVLEMESKDQRADNIILNRTVAQDLEERYSISMPVSKLIAESMYIVTVTPVGLQGLYGANRSTSLRVPARVPTQLENVTVSALSSSSVRVEWDPPAENHGVITHYTVKLQPLTRPRSYKPPLQTPVLTVSRSTLQTDVTNLLPDTMYQATVSVATAAGHGPPSLPSLVQTPSVEEVPTEPQMVSATALTSSKVRVQWEPPAENHGSLTYYIVTLEPLANPNSPPPPANTTIATVTGTTLQAEVDHLLAGTEYQVVVTAATTFGQGPPSAPSVVLTPPEKEGKVLLALEILRKNYILSRDLLCSLDPHFKEKEYLHLCPPTGEQ